MTDDAHAAQEKAAFMMKVRKAQQKYRGGDPMTAPKIITHYWAKPIPDRQFDWSAMEDGGNENMCGYGRTEAEAIADLQRLWAEEGDWLQEQQEREASR